MNDFNFDPNLLVLHNYLDRRQGFDFTPQALDTLEKGIAPTSIVASGTNFTPDVYGVQISAPSSRSRPLCPYPEQVRYVGGTTGLPGSLSDARNYECVQE